MPVSRKLELPVFDGENADSWVVRVDQYFELNEFTEEEKLQAVKMCFDDEALIWYRWERDHNPFTGWEKMKARVLENFSPTQDSSPRERLLKWACGEILQRFHSPGFQCAEDGVYERS